MTLVAPRIVNSVSRPLVVDVKGHVVVLSLSPQPIAQITLDHPWHPGRGNPDKGGRKRSRRKDELRRERCEKRRQGQGSG